MLNISVATAATQFFYFNFIRPKYLWVTLVLFRLVSCSCNGSLDADQFMAAWFRCWCFTIVLDEQFTS